MVNGVYTAGSPAVVRVLLVDDQVLVRKGLQRILNQEEDIDVVGECDDGDEVAAAVRSLQPDIVLMDVRMKRQDGIASTRELRAQAAAPPVMMLTTFGDDEVLWSALAAGAAGFVLKDASTDELVRATHVIAAGGAWLDPAITDKVLVHFRREQAGQSARQADIEALTAREREVLVLVAEGLLNNEIAERLHVSEATVKTHISHIFSKLGARDRAAAIVHAFNHGIVVPRR